jgi:hypothetical protein
VPKIIDNLLSGKPLTPSPNDIESRIGDTEGKLREADAQHGHAALEAEAGLPGASERLTAIAERRKALNERLETLRSALVAAHEEAGRRRARLHAKMKKENLARLGAALDARDEAATRLSEHIKAAVAAWRDLVDLSDKATLPGLELPLGSLVGVGELRRAVERELFRLGASMDHPKDFPGARSHDIELLDCPPCRMRLGTPRATPSPRLAVVLRRSPRDPIVSPAVSPTIAH